jgi:hypothetical protein
MTMNAAQLRLLREVVGRHAPEHAHLIDRLRMPLLPQRNARLCKVWCLRSSSSSVLGADSEPTPSGIELEELIDTLRHAIRPDRDP